jgi:uncharacterized membrane protein
MPPRNNPPRVSPAAQTSPELKNIQAIVGLERETLSDRSWLNRVTDGVSNLASSPAFIVVHLIWFGLWIGLNGHRSGSFDPYPFNLLTLALSLEAIVLTGFVLMAQSRMTQQAERRAHLDLQINLLAEQELTEILRVQCLLAEHAGIDLDTRDPRLAQLRTRTDVRQLAVALNHELAAVETSAEQPVSAADPARKAESSHEQTGAEGPSASTTMTPPAPRR